MKEHPPAMRGSSRRCRDTAELRRILRAEIPEAAFQTIPARALWFLPLLFVWAVTTAMLTEGRGGATVECLLVVIGGSNYASMLLLAHEVMHGAVVRSRRLQFGLSWLGFAPFLISPTLWRIWHNEVHHGNANAIDRDPDTFASEGDFDRSAVSRWILRMIPGAGGVMSAVFPFAWFCAHGQFVLWYQSKRIRGFERLDRARAKRETFAMAMFWLLLSAYVGVARAPLAVVAPVLVGNAILMSYIATNHLLRPLGHSRDPLECSMSVRTLGWIDRLHFRFSHHVEHHLFPGISGRYLPEVRARLERDAPDRFVCPSHLRALRWLYATPRTYRDHVTLVDPTRPERAPVDLRDLAERLNAPAKATHSL
jgi:fatty acid desaturase